MTTETLNVEYADWKLIRTRSAIQLVFEVPLENEAAAYALLGGMPSQGKSRWFKISRLSQQGAAQPQPVNPTIHPTPAGAVAKSYAQRIGILCQEQKFQRFLTEHFYRDNIICDNAVAAAGIVRRFCEVDSRAEIKENSRGGNRWLVLNSAYLVWDKAPSVGAA